MRTYAIGDVHGRADLLGELLSFVARENQAGLDDSRVVFLGDIIDRGPHSRQAMDLVVEELARRPVSSMILGNHEEFLLLFLDRPDKRDIVFEHWVSNGGLAAAASYGLDVNRPYPDVREAHDNLVELLNRHPTHIAVMRSAATFVRAGEYILVHAGLRPGIAIELQTEKDLRTIRAPFLESDFRFEQIVVHGHTVTSSRSPEVHANRIAIDTGADRFGVLTALVLEEGRPNRFLSTRVSEGIIAVRETEPLQAAQSRAAAASS
ncbi:metallophosphoesterase [Sinorhizobium meliloti]|uniref:metallophosphoesterase n=1 Tax=Rhizobium meliloti TaxID=382 RepID=UPI000FDA5CBC|nr:metallophosphoesterase [Sinorhizobium meliloti]RVK38547.1 serine/threonine protein phosphatase [Sinorhizobium meliloti]